MSNIDIREKAFSDFLDSDVYDEFQELLIRIARKAFFAGYDIKRSLFVPKIHITGLTIKESSQP